jgi:alkyl sulfatase BDS1-like metallo-beta-lactamase superfamily hydrolase
MQADFFRNSGVACIKVYLPGVKGSISIFANIADLRSKSLGKREIEEVIDILSRKKEAMLKQRNFPQIYDEMLTELIEVQRKRYGVKKDKKRRVGYSVSGGKLEEILGEYANIQNVHIDSIYVGSNKYNVERIGSESDDRYLVHLSFHEGIEDE